jgi:hypothetical protein
VTAAEWANVAGAFERRVLLKAMGQKGFPGLSTPYVWKGKGDAAFDVQKGLRPWLTSEVKPGGKAFDCSGFVLWAAREVTAVDVRAKWNAQVILDACREWESAEPLHATLRFYGVSRKDITHVAFGLVAARDAMPCLVLEAAGAGSDATSETKARELGAEVRFVEDKRPDFRCDVPLWALGVGLGALARPAL